MKKCAVLPEFSRLMSDTIVWDILASVADAVVTIDEEHRVVYCNKVAERMFGYSFDELVGTDVSPLIPEPHVSVHRGYVDRYLQTKEGRVIGKSRECSARRKDGSTFPVEISYSVSETAGKLYFTAVIRDISERKRLEHEVRFMEKLANVGKAVANVVHEIRKPLVLIGGFARQAESCTALKADEKTRRKLKIVVNEVKRLEGLLSGIHLLTRPEVASHKRPVSVDELLRETFELFDPMLQGKQIHLQTDIAPQSIPVTGDPDRLKQVFLNLLQNAVEALEGSGTIRVTARSEDGRARIEFENDGPAIPQEMADRIFDPFFTTKADGTGLGLAVTKNIINDHGGEISIRSEGGRGVSFIVTLPLSGE